MECPNSIISYYNINADTYPMVKRNYRKYSFGAPQFKFNNYLQLPEKIIYHTGKETRFDFYEENFSGIPP